MTGWIECVRGDVVESRHRVHVAVADVDGRLVRHLGDPGLVTFYRSAAKPLQALPLVEDGVVDRFGLGEDELALCCASHSGQPRHVAGVRSILARAGVDESALRCGPHMPFHEETAEGIRRDGGAPAPIHNNCSGKHAGMLALARAHGWDLDGYLEADHPVQRRMLREVCRWGRVSEDEVGVAVDGCGVPCFAVPLSVMASSFARFGWAGSGAGAPRVVAAMTGHPFMVAGTGRLCTDLMEAASGTVFVKTGAEGVYCGGWPEAGVGFALKVEDGGKRAADVALVRLLESLGALDAAAIRTLEKHRGPPVLNTRGERVGEIRAAFAVEAL